MFHCRILTFTEKYSRTFRLCHYSSLYADSIFIDLNVNEI